MIPLILVSLLACGEKDGGKVAEGPPVEDKPKQVEASAEGEGLLSVEEFVARINSAPGGDGPTEIRKGNELVGLIFRPKGTQTEYVYMANTGMPWTPKVKADPAAGGLATYPVQLSPSANAFAAPYDDAVSVAHERLWACTTAQCTNLEGVPSGVWEAWSTDHAFESALPGILQARFAIAVSIANFDKVVGNIGVWEAFDTGSCEATFSTYVPDNVHADSATMFHQQIEYPVRQFTEKKSSPAGASEAVVVVRVKVPKNNAGVKKVLDASEPAASGQTALGDLWCSQLAAGDCAMVGGQPTCAMATIGFTAPQPVVPPPPPSAE